MRKTGNRLAETCMIMALTAYACWSLPGWGDSSASPGEAMFGLSGGVSYVSRYVWRGQRLNEDPVLQPDITFSYDKLSLNLWGSINTREFVSGDNEDWKFQEIDWTLSYSFDMNEHLALDLGIIYYDFPGTGVKSTTELYGQLDFIALPLSPYIAGYADVDEGDCLYARAGLSHEFSLNEQLTLVCSASLGWGDSRYHQFYYGEKASAFSDFEISAGLDWAVSESITASVTAVYTNFLSSRIKRSAKSGYGDDDVYTAGISLAFEF